MDKLREKGEEKDVIQVEITEGVTSAGTALTDYANLMILAPTRVYLSEI